MEFRQSTRLIRLLLDGFWASQPCTIKYFGQTDNSFNGKKQQQLNTCAIISIFLITGSTMSEQHNTIDPQLSEPRLSELLLIRTQFFGIIMIFIGILLCIK